jgi:hypothetical protein
MQIEVGNCIGLVYIKISETGDSDGRESYYEKVSPQLNEPLYTRPVLKGDARASPC